MTKERVMDMSLHYHSSGKAVSQIQYSMYRRNIAWPHLVVQVRVHMIVLNVFNKITVFI